MRLHSLLSLIFATSSCALALILVGCGGPDGVRITEGQRRETAPMITNKEPIIVHIDLFERIATIRNGMALGDEFLITSNYAGVETAVLKARPNSLSETLLTADILEGDPKINNTVKTADSTRNIELAKIYRNPDREN
ncbi:MAG: hypothetical protein P8R37_12955 [Opitutae bacterium]|jgi:hypothetical protein|nr:hypothetical protein [Opitutae bacterium]MDG1302485.1 hypothetical protein [Opitutae bacterium]